MSKMKPKSTWANRLNQKLAPIESALLRKGVVASLGAVAAVSGLATILGISAKAAEAVADRTTDRVAAKLTHENPVHKSSQDERNLHPLTTTNISGGTVRMAMAASQSKANKQSPDGTLGIMAGVAVFTVGATCTVGALRHNRDQGSNWELAPAADTSGYPASSIKETDASEGIMALNGFFNTPYNPTLPEKFDGWLNTTINTRKTGIRRQLAAEINYNPFDRGNTTIEPVTLPVDS